MEPVLEFLLDNFNYIPRKVTYESKRRTLGASTGDDSHLIIDNAYNSTIIYWRQNRGKEYTIFDGRKLKTKEDFEKVFDLLGLKIEDGKAIFQH